jgi:hypothetical protein
MTDTYVHIRASRDLTTKRPQFVYEAECPVHTTPGARVVCQLTTNTNETGLWCSMNTDDEGLCSEQSLWTRLKKSYASMGTRFATVWQDTGQVNMTTGRVESDPKKFAQHLRDKSRIMEERLGMPVDFQPCDPSDTRIDSDEGLDSQHDRAVRDGRKDSRGRFVWTV